MGSTASATGIAHQGYRDSLVGNTDVYLAKFNGQGTRLWGTYWGGVSYQVGHDVATNSGAVYICGESHNGDLDAFLTKFDTAGNHQWEAIYIGGTHDDVAYACAVDENAAVYIAGYSQSQSGIFLNGFQNTNSIYGGGFVSKFSSSGSHKWGTYYGGNKYDELQACHLNEKGQLYLGGATSSSGLGQNAFQPSLGGNEDALVAKLEVCKSSGSEVVSACSEYTWDWNDSTYTSTGYYEVTLNNSLGCDSTRSVSLLLTHVNTDLLTTDTSLTAVEGGVSYQWVWCDSGYAPIVGAIGQTWYPSVNGNYAVVISKGSCTDTSRCHTINTLGTSDKQSGNLFSLYPNPNRGEVTLELDQLYEDITVVVIDATGRKVAAQELKVAKELSVEIPGPPGIYTIQIFSKWMNPLSHKVLKR